MRRTVVRRKIYGFRSLLVCLLLLGSGHPASAVMVTGSSIPDERLMDWTKAGVPGGIPSRTLIYITIKKAPDVSLATTGTMGAGSNLLTVASATGFEAGQGIQVKGAAFLPWTTTPGADLNTLIISVNGTTLTLLDKAQVSVAGISVVPDDAAGIQSAVNTCPVGQVVRVSEGVYVLSRGISIVKHGEIVLRGDGSGKTVLMSAVKSAPAISVGSGDWPPPSATIPITAGATKNSSSITVDSTAATASHAAFKVGGIIRIGAGVNPPYVHNIGVSSYDTSLSMTFRVVSLTANTVTFQPALPFDFTPYQPMAGVFNLIPLTGVGLEDLTVDLQGVGTVGVSLNQIWGSWVRNIEIKNSYNHILTLYGVLQSEVSHCYFHDTVRAGPNTEGLDFYRDSAWNLIEDNIVYRAGGIVLGDWEGGDVGNVMAYNLVYGTESGSADVAMADMLLNHGSNNLLNLIEGNITGGILADEYFGSTSHDMILRNWVTVTHPTALNNKSAIRLKHFSDYMTVWGNVLGTSAFPTSGSLTGNRAYGGYYDAPLISGYDNGASTGVQTIFELGFPNIGNTGFIGTIPVSNPIDYSSQGSTLATSQALDLNVAATLIRHGNFDYYNRAISWDSSLTDHTIPLSLVHTAKPVFFGNLLWPPFDPTLPPGALNDSNLERIPAGYRYLHGHDLAPAPGTGDVSGDSRVTMYDAALVLKYTVGGALTAAQQARADINGDTAVDTADAAEIAKRAVTSP